MNLCGFVIGSKCSSLMVTVLYGARFRVYELSFKSLCDLFDWWERAVGALSSSFMTDQQADLPDDKAAKRGKKATGLYVLLYLYGDGLIRLIPTVQYASDG